MVYAYAGLFLLFIPFVVATFCIFSVLSKKAGRCGCKIVYIKSLHAVFSKEARRNRLLVSLRRPSDRVAFALGETVETVRQVLKNSSIQTCSVDVEAASATAIGRPKTLDSFDASTIRSYIHRKFEKKEFFTTGSLLKELKSEGIVRQSTAKSTTLCLWLKELGFRFRITKRKRYVAKETMDLVSKRIRCLRQLEEARQSGRKLYYMDETWFTTRMTHGTEWVDTREHEQSITYSRQVPPGEGQRLVVIGAGSEDGFVNDAFTVFAARNQGGDYHGEVNLDLYVKWLQESLLPCLPEPSTIVIDNAPYHNALTPDSKSPTTKTRKDDIQLWLTERGITYNPASSRPELLQLVRQNKPAPKYVVDDVIHQHGHDVIRLPPGHPELNPIELIWGLMKQRVRSALTRFTITELKADLEAARQYITREHWSKAVEHTKSIEREYWRTDAIHETVPPVVIDLGDDTDTDSDEWGASSDEEET